MKTIRDAKSQKGEDGAVALAKALLQNENAKDLVANAAEELSSVNEVLKQELAQKELIPAVHSAIEKSEDVEGKVLQVSEKLAAVNRTLKVEVRGRILLDHQFAAANQQGDASRYAAFHDALTGLPNRALFQDRLAHGLAQAERHRWNLAIMFVDLDGFKAINDTHGHDAGDRVLQAIAKYLRQSIRSDNTICRYGGDEFLCLVMETREQQDLTEIAKKMINAIQAPCEVRVGDDVIKLSVSASIGIALFPQHGTTPEALIKNADTAMYRAKKSASRVEFAK